MKNSPENVTKIIAQTQDGKSIKQDNAWNNFLREIIERNTEGYDPLQYVNYENVKNDLRYGIDQFKRALSAIEEELPLIEEDTTEKIFTDGTELLKRFTEED